MIEYKRISISSFSTAFSNDGEPGIQQDGVCSGCQQYVWSGNRTNAFVNNPYRISSVESFSNESDSASTGTVYVTFTQH
jgi:hypothetical protein